VPAGSFVKFAGVKVREAEWAATIAIAPPPAGTDIPAVESERTFDADAFPPPAATKAAVPTTLYTSIATLACVALVVTTMVAVVPVGTANVQISVSDPFVLVLAAPDT
jgi:hypothetical protein